MRRKKKRRVLGELAILGAMCVLQLAGKLDRFTTFSATARELTDAVRALPYVKNKENLADAYVRFAVVDQSSALGREVVSLVERSKRYHRKRALMQSVIGRAVSRFRH